MTISVIIPCLNEADHIPLLLENLQPMRKQGLQVIVVDGGSHDNTRELAHPLSDQLITTRAGRARQMNAGADIAEGNILWFLHADTLPAPSLYLQLQEALGNSSRIWGRFDIRLSGSKPMLRLIEFLMNRRSRITGIATGDQGIFVHAKYFRRLGGFADIPLMEDIELSKSLKNNYGRPICLSSRLYTSSRRWESRGIVKTIFLMWQLRLRYSLGANPDDLAGLYK
jgi:rSAM/selenodomain-associated transferase 2